MIEKTCQSSFDPKAGIGIDYALMAGGVAATLIALTYLILI
jgi:hypothetical protein